MLDFFTAIALFFTIMFFTQEWVLEFRLGNLGRFWSLMSAASLFISAVLCAVIIIPLIIKIQINVLTLTGNLIISAVAAVIFAPILWLGQWLILRQTEITPRIFALINTIVGIVVCSALFWFNRGSLGWSGSPIEGWKMTLLFLFGGAATGAATGKALDFYCWRIEQRLLRLEREQIEFEAKEKERLEREAQERKRLEEEEMLERKRIQREMALEEERKWYEEQGLNYEDYQDFEGEDDEDEERSQQMEEDEEED